MKKQALLIALAFALTLGAVGTSFAQEGAAPNFRYYNGGGPYNQYLPPGYYGYGGGSYYGNNTGTGNGEQEW